MAEADQHIVNPRTGQEMTFVELSDELLRIDTINPPGAEREPRHVHPYQESGAEVMAGSLVFEVDGQESTLGVGDSISIPANTPHRFWVEGNEPAYFVQFFRPALQTASLFETFFVLAQQGKLNDKGFPGPMQLAVTVREFGAEIRPVRPPWFVLRALAALLGPLARRRGFRGRLLETDNPSPGTTTPGNSR
jgi:mannose-6-phosphate isomerase-like protein (cupin superfamily)